MKIKVNKHKLNIHYRGSPWGSRTQQHAYCLRYAHSHHIESHLGKKQLQAKIAIVFLFRQLHFNNVTSHAFFGGHLVLRSKRCAVQNQGITLNRFWYKVFVHWKWKLLNFLMDSVLIINACGILEILETLEITGEGEGGGDFRCMNVFSAGFFF